MNDDKAFFDTNILIYCFDLKDARKREGAHSLVLEYGALERGAISYQVHQEFASVAIRMLRDTISVRRMLSGFEQLAFGLVTVGFSERIYHRAIDLWDEYSLSWYDALIVAAALEGRCGILYTEDMQHGLEIDGMRIVNPFR
jgi:predicted nucleic acid-binding protein